MQSLLTRIRMSFPRYAPLHIHFDRWLDYSFLSLFWLVLFGFTTLNLNATFN